MDLNLDIRTLALLTVLIALAYFWAMLLLQKSSEPIAGLSVLTWAFLVKAIGFLLFSFGSQIHLFVSKIIANTLICVAFSLFLLGLCKFRDAPVKIAVKMIAMIIPVFILLMTFTFWAPSTNARILIMSSYVMLCSAVCCWVTYNGKFPDLKAAKRVLVLAFGSMSLFMLLRFTATTFSEELDNFFQAPWIDQLAFIAAMFLLVAIGFTIPWMVNARLVRAIYQSSMKDSLTHLYNRRALEEFVPREIARTHRHHGHLSIIMTDFDNFKTINDQYGHHIGDTALKGFGQILSNNLRKQDLSFRLGGDEFLILLPETSEDDARKVANKIRHHVEHWQFSQKQKEPWTVSLGIAQFLPDEDWDSAIKRADAALYLAKRSGRNQVAQVTDVVELSSQPQSSEVSN